jgi:hypothetical protein
MMGYVGILAVTAGLMLAQAGNPIVNPPVGVPPPTGSTQNPTVINNTTNVFPPPDPEVTIATEAKAAPVIMQSGLQSIDTDGGKSVSQVFQLALTFGSIRKDIILSPIVQDLNRAMQRVIWATVALFIAALCLWGVFSQFLGSDAWEAFEALSRVPLWCLLAASSLQWYGMALDLFAKLGGVIATSGDAAFGPTLRSDFWSNAGLGLFALFVGLIYLLILAVFAIQLIANTAFLAFCAIVAPVFVFLKITPWTSSRGDNWFRMAPATAADLLAMLMLLTIGAKGLDKVTVSSAFGTIGLDLGLLLCLPLVRRLFGLEGGSAGTRLIGGILLVRTLRGLRGGSHTASSAGAATVGAAATSSATAATRAPRWAHSYGWAATPKPVGVSGKA